ncbi:hypothetical protein P5W98_03415 [Paraburkholderia sp. A1BS-2L]|uniref:hypothetical protein n=1 Tax=Paraburkholderia sp. A1BS-2L TaxID=3028373 RepID=UPI003DA9728D
MKGGESRASEALEQLLEKIPIIEIKDITSEAASSQWQPDMVARLLVDGRPHVIVCEYKSNAQPRYARPALLELRDYVQRTPLATPVFMAPYTSSAVRQLCEEKGVGYLDLEGNARIAFGGVFIERIAA